MTPHPDEDRFIRAVAEVPEDEATRLVYADWLEEHGEEARSAYLRTEAACFRLERRERRYEWVDPEGVDPAWANMVARCPAGILRPGLTFRDGGPPANRDDLKALEERWGQPLPPDYAAFLLLYNGGTPSLPYLWSFQEHDDEEGLHTSGLYAAVRLFALGETGEDGEPCHWASAADACVVAVSDGEADAFDRMMWIGTLSYGTNEDGEEDVTFLFLLMDPAGEGDRYIELEWGDSDHQYLTRSDEVNNSESFVGLIHQLVNEGETT